MALTTKQIAVMRWLHDDTSESIALLQGDVRSGKTWVSALALLTHSLTRTAQYYIILGQSRGSLERSVLPALQSVADLFGLDYVWDHKKQAYRVGANWFVPAGAGTDVVGVVLMGMAAAGALIDEATLLSREVIDYVLSRVDQIGARVLFTFNPFGPHHWLRQDWLLGGDMPHQFFEFKLDEVVEAGIIDASVRERLHATLSGHRARRWLHGEWAGAAGLCLPSLQEVEALGPPYSLVEAGLDFGLSNPTAGVFFGQAADRNWETVGEYVGSESGLTASDHADRLIELGSDLGCTSFVIDPAALPLKNALRQRGAHVVGGDNSVAAGIDVLESGLASGRVRVTADAPNLLREGASYSWDERSSDDKPIKKDDHSCDAARYWGMHRLRAPRAYITQKPRGL